MKKPYVSSLSDLIRNKKNKNIRVVLVRIEETKFWDEKIQQKANGKIYGVYLIDLTSPTNLAEITTSFPATFVQNHFSNISNWQNPEGEWKSPEEEEELATNELNSGDNEVRYYSENSSFEILDEIRMSEKELKKLLDNFDIHGNIQKAKDVWLENLRESYQFSEKICCA